MRELFIPYRIPHAWEQQGLKLEEGAYTRIIVNEQHEIWKKGSWTLNGEKFQTIPNKR